MGDLGKDFEFQPPYYNHGYFPEKVEGVVFGRYRKVEIAQFFSVRELYLQIMSGLGKKRYC